MIGPCEHNNESSGSIESEEFPDQLSDYKFPKKPGSHGCVV